MFNKIIIIGNMTKDIELRYTNGGTAIASSGIATTRKYKDSSGQQKEETLFVDFAIFGKAAEIANQYVSKGSKILIEGRLKFDQWTDNSGQKRSRHSIVVENFKMLDGRAPQQNPQGQSVPEIDINEDEMPF